MNHCSSSQITLLKMSTRWRNTRKHEILAPAIQSQQHHSRGTHYLNKSVATPSAHRIPLPQENWLQTHTTQHNTTLYTPCLRPQSPQIRIPLSASITAHWPLFAHAIDATNPANWTSGTHNSCKSTFKNTLTLSFESKTNHTEHSIHFNFYLMLARKITHKLPRHTNVATRNIFD